MANQILTILRANGEWMTVRDVHTVVAEDRSIAYTTVLTVMQRLVQQGHLDHVREGRSGQFRVTEHADPTGARSLVDQAIARFGAMAVTQFVERSREDPELLAELRRQLKADDDKA
ncbi:MAG: hypothetical protein JWM90_2858 [Thermoleophilia bacterium]|nr:hypothetical protein [Thermoleophilia bacterium]